MEVRIKRKMKKCQNFHPYCGLLQGGKKKKRKKAWVFNEFLPLQNVCLRSGHITHKAVLSICHASHKHQ